MMQCSVEMPNCVDCVALLGAYWVLHLEQKYFKHSMPANLDTTYERLPAVILHPFRGKLFSHMIFAPPPPPCTLTFNVSDQIHTDLQSCMLTRCFLFCHPSGKYAGIIVASMFLGRCFGR